MKKRIFAFVCFLFCVACASGSTISPVASDICKASYLWLDASRADTLVTNAAGEVTAWTSANPSGGIGAAAYTLSSYSPSGPTVAPSGLVSFGSTSANRDLNFTKSTAIRSVFMVAKVEKSGNAFLLGDNEKFNFHRGGSGEYWHSTHGYAKNGKTFLNGTEVTSPTASVMPEHLALIDVQATVDLTASQLCYDRKGNDGTPRRGGKDIAEVLIFTNALSEVEQKAVRDYLMAKWNLFGVGGAEVVRAHPRLTAGLERESLIGIKLTDGASGALTNLTVRFDLTNCTPDQISDVRVWRQKYDPIPFAFFERDAVELKLEGVRNEELGIGNGGKITINFSNSSDPSNTSNLTALTVYPKSGSMSEGDYIWITAKMADDLATNAEIWTSIAGDRVQLASGDFRLENQTARSPHRPFPFKYHIGAYVRQDRLVGKGSITSDIFTGNPKERFETLTDVLPIYSAHDGYSNGKFYVSGWADGDTASTKRIVGLRDQYNAGCMVRPSLVPNNWVTANGIYGLAFETAGAGAATRKQFAAAIVDFLVEQHCDGLDIDYEWVRDGTNHREWQNIGRMLRELSEQFFDHGFVLSFAGRSHDSAQSGMPYNSADYGAFHACDFIMSQTYGGGYLNAAPCIQRRGLAVCTSRGLPARRVVLGQAAYVSADGHPGWDGASNKVAAFTDDPLRRFDIDTWWKSPYTSYWPFEGPSSLQAQCLWVRREEIGGVMSWGYYTDPTWDGWNSFARHQSKAVWPMPWSWLTPEVKVEGQGQEWYLLKNESDWFWLEKHPNVKARLANDITLEHDPVVIDCWSGELDGDGHKLIFAKDTWVVSEKATGLIRTLKGTVRNLTVEMNGRVFTIAPRWNDQTAAPANVRLVNTMEGENPVGVIAAEAGDGAVIENVKVVMGAGSEVKGVKSVGALVGQASGTAVITNNAVEIGGKLHIEIRNVWDTLFQPSSPALGTVVGKVNGTDAIVAGNASKVVAGGEVEDLDAIPEPKYELSGTWHGPTGWDAALPLDLDVRSDDYALEVVLELPAYKSMSFGESYPQLVRLTGTDASVALSVSTAGGCELFLTGDNTATYAYPISRGVLRTNKDVGSGVPLTVDATNFVKIVIENRGGELRVLQNGEVVVVTDKNTSANGYVASAQIGGGLAKLGGGRVVSARFLSERRSDIIHPAGYGKLIFDDEFDGSALDTNSWEKVPVEYLHVNWRQYTSHREDLVAVSNGCLVLTGVENDGRDPNETRKFLCGQVQSSGKFNFKYGIVEIRAKFENQDGAWPAMWMMPQNSVHGGWPQSGEIDITERLNSDAKVYQTCHFGVKDTTSGTTATINNGAFNVYRLEWTENKITWYVNGVQTHAYSNPGTGYLAWPFDSPFYFILSQQLEGSWVGTVDDTSTLPVRMYVDYVRVWQKDADAPQKNAYLWLDAANDATITTNAAGEVTEWASANLLGNVAQAYSLSSYSPYGPTLTNGAVSFGSSSDNRDLKFDRATDVRAIFMVAKTEQSGNAFLLGDSSNYDFHRGSNGEWWSSGNASKSILGGQTFWNGAYVTNPTDETMPSEWGLVEVHTTNGVTASQICYDRAGNGDVPRRGGKDIAELVIFRGEDIGYADRLKLRAYLMKKWLPDVAHPSWSISDDWVLRQETDFSSGASIGEAFRDGAGTYAFRRLKLTGGLQDSAHTLRVEDGDEIELSGDTLNGRCRLGFDVRGGKVTFPACAATWYENASFKQSGGTFVSLATSKSQSGTGDGFMLGYNGSAMALDISGGLFAVTNSSLNFYDPLTLNIGGSGIVRAKGVFRCSGSAATVNVNAGGRLEIGALGLKASSCTLNLNGGTLCGYEADAFVNNDICVTADSALDVPANVVLAVRGAVSGTGKLQLAGEGKVRFYASIPAVNVRDGVATSLINVADDFPTNRIEVIFSCDAWDADEPAARLDIVDGVLTATPRQDKDILGFAIAETADWSKIATHDGTIDLLADLTIDATVEHAAELKGVLNGNGHTLYVKDEPLFTKVTGTISNLNVIVIGDITGNGVVAGSLAGNGCISDVTVTINRGVTITGTGCCGGIVGEIWAASASSTASVRDCEVTVNGTLTATQYGRVGGVVGHYNSSCSPANSVIERNVVRLERYARLIAPSGTTTWCGVGGVLGNMNVTDAIVRDCAVYRNEYAVLSGPAHVGDVVGGNCWGGTPSRVSGNTAETVPDPDYVPPNWTHFTTSTSSSPAWTAPDDGEWTKSGSCTIAKKPIGFSVGSTAATLTINLIATLPAETSGALAGWKIGDNTVQLVYDHATDRFDVTYNGTTSHANTVRSAPANVTAAHVYTIAITAAGTGTFVYQDGSQIVSAPNVYWGGKTLGTAYTLGAAVDGSQALTGLAVQAADFNFAAAANAQSRILAGYEDLPSDIPMDFAMRVITETADTNGNLTLPPVEVNGESVSGSKAVSALWLFGGDLSTATNFTFGLAAPVMADGQIGLTLGADDPVNAALRLETAKRPDGPWQTAAEIAPGTSDRTFVFAADDDASFYKLTAASAMTTEAAQGMPVSLTSASRVNLGNVTLTADDLTRGMLEVQLAGAGVAEGMIASLQVDGVALVAHATASGQFVFDLSALQPPLSASSFGLSLYTIPGMTNGDIRVVSPAVTGLTYTPAVLTATVADTLYADGLTEQNYGWAYRIPSLVTDGNGEVLCLYDVRYGGGDLGTGSGIDIGETYSADFGKTFAKPHLAIDVPNTCNEKNVSISQSRTNDLGDVATLYDPATETYWLMGMGGRGLNVGDYYQNDVLLYKKVKVEGQGHWEKVRSIQNEIATQEGITNSTGGLRFGFLQGPGHGMVTKVGTAAMPAGTLVFPMQYFVDGWSSTVGAIYSTDHGATWTATRRSTGGTTPQENCVMELDDGSWYMTTKAGSRPGTGRINFFRTTDYVNWTYVGEHYPVPCQQGSCLRLGTNAADGKGRYVLCHTLHPDTATRARLALVFGTDTTGDGDAAGVAWDFDNPLMLYYDNTGFKGYNSLAMIDENTLGVLYEAQGHIYFVRIDVSDRLE